MDKVFPQEPMLEMFIFETLQLMEQLERMVLNVEKHNHMDAAEINEVFRIMHTIKGSAAMMMFNNIARLAHSLEDAFYFLREDKPRYVDYVRLSDLILLGLDFIKAEITKLQINQEADGDASALITEINEYLSNIGGGNAMEGEVKARDNSSVSDRQKFYISACKNPEVKKKQYRARIFFESGCEMENIRAFSIIHKLKNMVDDIDYFPPDIVENPASIEVIRQDGFEITFFTEKEPAEMQSILLNADFVAYLDLVSIDQANRLNEPTPADSCPSPARPADNHSPEGGHLINGKQNMISVNVSKLDQLLDLVGELVTSEAMVSSNPDLLGNLNLSNFHKAVRQHRKIINELQDVVMSIRMVPLTITFQKMYRIVRDMSKKLNKEVELIIKGEETEVDKNIIEHLSDPLMHLIRNAVDHGIESREDRVAHGKPAVGSIILEARNEGGDVWIMVKDDGAGLDRAKILARARELDLITKADYELSDREIFASILMPGFSTRDEINEFSGRGVGMDVVARNVEEVGGLILVDSQPGLGTTVSLKIPLTLAIIAGMEIKVGNSIYIVPTTSIKETFKVAGQAVIHDLDGNEMIMVRGDCYPVLRLHRHYHIQTDIVDITEGIIIIVENDSRSICLFADAILGEQQVVVKALPRYLNRIKGIGGCTLLGNGQASLILDVAGLINR